jgi:hypothetical protein
MLSMVCSMLAPAWRDAQSDRGLAVVIATDEGVFHRIVDVGHVPQAYGAAVLIGDDQRLIVGGLVDLVVGIDHPALPIALQNALGLGMGGVVDGGAHGLQRDPGVVEQIGLDVDAHRRQRAAAHRHFTHTVDLSDLLLQLAVSQVIQLARAAGR